MRANLPTGGARTAAGAALVLRIGLGALLVVAGALKVQAPADLAADVAKYQLFPGLAPYLGATLPTIEIVVGLVLAASPWRWRRAAALAALGLFSVFLAAVSSALLRHINIACGCFGGAGGSITAATVARNLGLVLAAAALLALDGRGSAGSHPNLPAVRSGRQLEP